VKLVNESDELTKNMIVDYESNKVEYGKQSKTNKVETEDIKLKKYASIFEGEPDLTTSF